MYVIHCARIDLTCPEKERNNLRSLNMGHGVEERSLADTVHVVDVRPELQADLGDVQPVVGGEGPGTAGLVEH